MSIEAFIIASLGFCASACAVAWLLALGWHLCGKWPLRERRGPLQSRMMGGCAKDDWRGLVR